MFLNYYWLSSSTAVLTKQLRSAVCPHEQKCLPPVFWWKRRPVRQDLNLRGLQCTSRFKSCFFSVIKKKLGSSLLSSFSLLLVYAA